METKLIGIEIGKLRNRLYRIQKQSYVAEAETKLTVEEFILLNTINDKSDQISQNIAIATGKNKSVVMRMIDSLESKGLVVRTQNPDDRRENLLNITAEGEYVVAQYHVIERGITEYLTMDVTPDKLNVFWEVLATILEKAKKS
ncbi:MAG: MarR family winged helix-turn-helix transcriptional regulator [Muribaculaceae bacterium]|nr:MarR family winged helix-turn-helix transcriptional regulator [Muribaculaceae bacterium]